MHEFYPGTSARPIRLEDEPEEVQRLYHWSGVVTLIGVILVIPTLTVGLIQFDKESGQGGGTGGCRVGGSSKGSGTPRGGGRNNGREWCGGLT